MVKLAERNDAIDLVTLKEDPGRPAISTRYGPAYITALVDGVQLDERRALRPIIKEKATLRNLIFSANDPRPRTRAKRRRRDFDQAEHAISPSPTTRSATAPAAARICAIQPRHDRAVVRARSHHRCATGFTDLDELTSGLQPSTAIVRPVRRWKTSLVLNIAQHVGTKTAKTVGIFSLKCRRSSCFSACSRPKPASTPSGCAAATSANVTGPAVPGDRDAQRGEDFHRRFAVDRRAGDAGQVPASGREHQLDLIIIDYIQLMQGRGRFENRTLELAPFHGRSRRSPGLRVPVVLSQLSRAPESRADHRPQLPTCASPVP
jgi:replicative DNA helicase